MSIAMICTGTELLKGSATNTNLAFLGRELAANAMPPVREITVGDTPSELCAALGDALKYADILIISGGLGPTTDDLTLETTARFFGLSLVENPELKEKVARFWSFHHPDTRCPKNQYKQGFQGGLGTCFPTSHHRRTITSCRSQNGCRMLSSLELSYPLREYRKH